MQNRLTMLPRLVLWTAFAFGLTACSSLTHRERNTITGAAIGGVAGAVLTGGSSAGTVGGAAIGGVIGHQIGGNKKSRPLGPEKSTPSVQRMPMARAWRVM